MRSRNSISLEHRDAPLVLPEPRLGHALQQRVLARGRAARRRRKRRLEQLDARPALARQRAQRRLGRRGSTSPSGASGSSKVTFRPSLPARTNRNWSPSGTSWPAIASASGVRKCRSTARFSGRAPRSGVKPWVNRNSNAESSNSTAHERARRPRRASTASSSAARISRITGRVRGRNTTVRSIRLRNSGRNAV